MSTTLSSLFLCFLSLFDLSYHKYKNPVSVSKKAKEKKMKLKIVHQNQETRVPEQQPTTMKEEQVEPGEQETNDVDPRSQMNSSPISDMILSGKRKRKPKELIDAVPTIFLTKAKKKNKSGGIVNDNVKSSDSKMNNRIPNTGGASSSKGDNPAQMKTPTMIQAEAVQASLGSEKPSFLKVLVRSHVGSCFWMGLPVPFCKVHLPSTDTTVTVEDENGEEFPVKYIAHKTGLSAGWRRFVSASKLIEGDVLVFQLTGPCRLKVYIVRSHDMNEVDGALGLLILDSQTKQNDAGKQDTQNKKKRRPKSLPLTVVHKRKLKEEEEREEEEKLDGEQSGNDSNDVDSEVLEGSKFSKSSLNFKDVKSFENFHIVVNGLCIDSELPEETRRDYYDLCRNRNSFLHNRVLPGLYSKLAAGMIVEFVTITKAIRGCKVTTEKKDFEVWENSLRSFELLGLNVGFVRSRLRRLMSLAYDSEGALQVRKYLDIQKEKSYTEEEIVKLEMKLLELKQKMSEKYGRKLESLKAKAESFELEFLEAVNAPW